MNPINRSYYQLNASNILSTKRVPSLTPPKNYPSSVSKDKITKQVKDKAISGNSQQKSDVYNLPMQNALFLQQQNAILSARKATINLSDSSDKLRKTSPNEKSPINPRLSTLQKNKQISISQSQQAIAQVLAKMQENDNISYMNKQLYHNPEIESTQKSTINSREYTNNSSKHKTEDYQKLQRENLILQRKVFELEQKISALESVNQQLLTLVKSCDCHQTQLRELELTICNLNYLKETVNPIQIQNLTSLDMQSNTEFKKKLSYSQDYSEIKPQNLFTNHNSTKMIEQFIEQHQLNQSELNVFKDLTKKMEEKQAPIPSVLKALSLVINV
ncbi:unnamed protein product (macronuclear) [Paramecium tetraurelia]|uniref:BZIP domain-containing protein n=2 Tax=Paramecium TaxID=5884 RepID=A0CR73_PARTE|nr:uncharacterized protein GSPATT00009605001 [Paramecium tetraurelia]CAD8150755.1 unnamed protein product [Paramecium octaurelia]CAK73290.1 unnamed protein product [Paramecium tetraurelia]|eukprot:XP_001440687.1 hypothetical protein (macronuclear) [Paramecium tetraurelia strain d4-2]